MKQLKSSSLISSAISPTEDKHNPIEMHHLYFPLKAFKTDESL
jgi:hypothetical protein